MSKALECTNSEGAQIPSDGISLGLLQSQEEAIYVNTAVKEKKNTRHTAGCPFLWQRTAMALPSLCLWQHKPLYLKSHSFL